LVSFGGGFTWAVAVARFKGDNMLFGTTDIPALHMGFRNARPRQGFWNNDNHNAADGNPPVASWHHIAFRYDHDLLQSDIFVDGVNVSTASNFQPYGQTQSLLIGRTIPNNGAFAGLIEYPRVFNVALPTLRLQQQPMMVFSCR
jgi:hypothetical protein